LHRETDKTDKKAMNNDVKKRILIESMQLMFSYGIKAMTMDELAKRIGVSKRTIYEYFEDKNALLTAIILYNKKQKETESKKILEKSPTIIHAFFHHINNFENPLFSKIVSYAHEIKRYHPAVYQKVVSGNEKQELERIKILFELGIEQGVFCDNLNVDIVAFLFRSALYQFWSNENGVQEQVPLGKLLESFMTIFIRGCCTEKGLKIVEKLT
jgi:AcrR family transcriptional regulator